jgi:CRISPR-associated protein Cas1
LETAVYVDRQGAVVRKRGDRLVVTADGEDGQEESLLRLGLRRVRQVVCYGRVSLTTPFLHEAAERGIDVVLLTDSGELGARLATPATSDPQARRAQYAAADDAGRSRDAAAAFIGGKPANMRTGVLRAALREDDADAYVASELIGELAEAPPTSSASREPRCGSGSTAHRPGPALPDG